MKRLLIVEDEQTTRELMIRLLSGARKCFEGDVKIEQASNWEEGAAYVEQGGIDVVLLDLSLPPHSREETSIKFAAVAKTWPPTIIVTGHSQDEVRRRLTGFGAADFMDKDLAVREYPESLMERIYNAWLRGRYHGPA